MDFHRSSGKSGAGAGAVAGIGAVLLTRGRPTILEPESQLTFRLVDPVKVNTTHSQQPFLPVSQEDFENYRGSRPRFRAGNGYYGYPGYAPAPCGYGYPYPCYYYPARASAFLPAMAGGGRDTTAAVYTAVAVSGAIDCAEKFIQKKRAFRLGRDALFSLRAGLAKTCRLPWKYARGASGRG